MAGCGYYWLINMMNFDELGGGFKYVFFLFSVQNWWTNPSSTLRGLGGSQLQGITFMHPWVPGSVEYLHETICIRRLRLCLNDGFWPTYEQAHVKFWPTYGDICLVQLDNHSGCWGFDVCFYTKTIQISWPYPNGLVSLHKSLRSGAVSLSHNFHVLHVLLSLLRWTRRSSFVSWRKPTFSEGLATVHNSTGSSLLRAARVIRIFQETQVLVLPLIFIR